MTAKGAYVIVDPHNYARHNGEELGAGLTNAEIADLWTKLATVFRSNSKIIFGIMYEPKQMTSETWYRGAQAAINAIRATGATNLILVPGNGWTGAHSWNENWYGAPNSKKAIGITDSKNNFAFEVHQYLDSDYSGTQPGCKSSTIAVSTLYTFTSWLKTYYLKGFLGGFAGTNDTTCVTAIVGMLDFMESNSDVWIGWTWWAGAPMWENYMFTLEPNGGDRPQMAWLASHLSRSVVSSSSSAIPSSSSTVSSSSAVNIAPVASADSYTTQEDGILEVYTWNKLLSNDIDPDGDALTAILITSPSHGTIQFNTDGTFIYTPIVSYSGENSFTYAAFDGNSQSNAATVSIAISAQNDNPIVTAPIAHQNLLGGFAPFTIDLSGVFTDPDNDALTLSMDGIWIANGSLAGTTLSLSPASGMAGTQAVTLRASDNKGGQAVSTFELTVEPWETTKVWHERSLPALNWKMVVQQISGMAILRDLYGREISQIQLPTSPESIQNIASAKKLFLIQVGKQTFRLD